MQFFLYCLCSLLFLSTPAQSLVLKHKEYLEAPAVVSDAQGNACLQCWQLTKGFTTYPTVGKAIQLGDTSNVTYVVLPPRSEEGYHKPPHAM
jgi:hypothetical protein